MLILLLRCVSDIPYQPLSCILSELFGCSLRPGIQEEILPKSHEVPPEVPSFTQIFTMDKIYASCQREVDLPKSEGNYYYYLSLSLVY